MLVLLGVVVAALILYLGSVENCDRVTRGWCKGLGARVLMGMGWMLLAVVAMVPLLMDVVLAVKVEDGDDNGVMWLPVGKEGKVVGLYVGYILAFLLPGFCS
jgi:hypothetical protein